MFLLTKKALGVSLLVSEATAVVALLLFVVVVIASSVTTTSSASASSSEAREVGVGLIFSLGPGAVVGEPQLCRLLLF